MNLTLLSRLFYGWFHISPWLLALAVLGGFWLLVHPLLVKFVPAEWWLKECRSPWARIVFQPRSWKWPWLLGAVGSLGLGAQLALENSELVAWCCLHPGVVLAAHGGLLLLLFVVLALWDAGPSYLRRGEGRADAQFRNLAEDWGRFDRQDGKQMGMGIPVAVLLGYRDPSRLARRALLPLQRKARNLAQVHLRWDLLSRHIFILGTQGSGKTTAFFGHIMRSASCPWIYQDSKAELPFREWFPDRPVWGLDVRGYATRSAVLNFMEEIRTPEDYDLIVDMVFPINPRDNNQWVRDMSRVLFNAILHAREWASLQEISRTLRATRMEQFLQSLDPIWRDLLKEPKSQVPILQDLVATLVRWESPRVSAITEGPSTITMDDFIARGGWVMNCEMTDGLRAPVQLFWAMLLNRLRNRPEGAPPTLLLLDEFGDCGRIPNIERALILLRSKGVSFVAGIQNLGMLKDVYPQNWQAVAQGFGTKIWLLRNADDETRETLTRALGKWTRKVPASSAKTRPTEKEVDLMPIDAWAHWSDERAALARSNGFTYWLPLSLPIPSSPLGALLRPEDLVAGTPEIPWEPAAAPAEFLDAEPISIPGLELLQSLGSLPAPPQPKTGYVPVAPSEEEWL